MSNAIQFEVETVRSLAFGSIVGGGTYTAVGTVIDHPARLILIQNLTDATLMFSFNGTADHFPLATLSHLMLDITTNKTRDHGYFLEKNKGLYVTQIGAPTTGSVYFTSFYAD